MNETEMQTKLRVADWLPIDDAPKDGTIIDLWFSHPGIGYRPMAFWCERLQEWAWSGNDDDGEPLLSSLPNLRPTHWLPSIRPRL